MASEGAGLLRAGDAAASLPMDEAARMARDREMGYSDEVFYRGQKADPTEGAIAHYSRDPGTSAGFGDMQEYRLRMERPLRDHGPVTIRDFYDAAKGVEEVAGTEAADRLMSAIPLEGDWTLRRLEGVLSEAGDMEIMTGGALRQITEKAAGDAVAPLRAAGFDAMDSGRDVRTLTGHGQRLKDAAFDPAKWNARDVMAGAGIAGLLGVPLTRDRDER